MRCPKLVKAFRPTWREILLLRWYSGTRTRRLDVRDYRLLRHHRVLLFDSCYRPLAKDQRCRNQLVAPTSNARLELDVRRGKADTELSIECGLVRTPTEQAFSLPRFYFVMFIGPPLRFCSLTCQLPPLGQADLM